ncbi:MAG: hypothetical protein MUC83_11400 [Pirellula sp.]|jgi:hypothetical protein|nr:hypothetical protein [Pirellula sp.]
MNSIHSKRAYYALSGSAPKLALLALSLAIFSGCQQFPWPGSQQAKQFQVDSERILGEFRAQKKRADELAAKNQQLEARLAETEKSLARQNLQSLAQSNSSSSRNNRQGSSTSNPAKGRLFVGPPDDDPGLPDTPPSMSGLLTSSGGFSRTDKNLSDTGDNKESPQWRPVRRK